MTLGQKIRGKLNGIRSLSAFDNFWQLLVERLVFFRTNSVIHRLGDMEILADYAANEQNSTRSGVAEVPYSCFTSRMELAGPLNVLDLGASGGGFALMLRHLNHTLKTLVAVELNPRTYGRLCFNLYRNFDCRIEAVHAGVAERSGKIALALGEGSLGDSIFLSEAQPGVPMTTVSLVTLEEIMDRCFGGEEIDLCKMDIEGAEFPILESEVGGVLRRIRNLIIEVHDHPRLTEDWVHARLAGWGFDLLEVRSPYEPNVFGYIRR